MNFRFVVVSAKDLPFTDVNGLSDPFVMVYQTCLSKILIGTTEIQKKNLNPTWNQAFPFYGIRGLKFKLIIWDYDCIGKNDKLGKVIIDPTNIKIGENTWVPIEVLNGTLVQNSNPSICVRIELNSSTNIPFSPLIQGSIEKPIPYNYSVYFRLSHDPPYEPDFPNISEYADHNIGHALTELDISLIPFLPSGNIRTHSFFKMGQIIPISHSDGTVGCSSNLYGPVVRADLRQIFKPDPVPNMSMDDLPASSAILIVNSASDAPLSDFKTISIEVLICDENTPSKPSPTIITAFGEQSKKTKLEKPTGNFYVYKTFECNYEEGTTCAAAIMLTPKENGVELKSMNWFVPNAELYLQPRGPMEALPEIANLAGFSNSSQYPRMLVTPSFVPRSLNSLAKSLCKKRLELFTLDFIANYKHPVVLHLGALVFNNQLEKIGECTECLPYMKRTIVNQGISASLGCPTQTVQIDFKKLGPEVQYICLYITSSLENCNQRELAYAHVEINREVAIEKVPIPSTKLNVVSLYGILMKNDAGWNFAVCANEWAQFLDGINPEKITSFVSNGLGRILGPSL